MLETNLDLAYAFSLELVGHSPMYTIRILRHLDDFEIKTRHVNKGFAIRPTKPKLLAKPIIHFYILANLEDIYANQNWLFSSKIAAKSIEAFQ